MRSTFYGLEISKSGLFTAQNQLDVTGHNISNVNTEGYTRQRVLTSALPPVGDATFIAVDRRGLSGRGVETLQIRQIRNEFLDYQYRKENSVATKLNMKSDYFANVESLFNGELEKIESSTGMTALFTNFYNALNEFSKDTANLTIRENLKETALTLTQTMNAYYTRLMDQQDTLNEAVRVSAVEINDIANEIAQLNVAIYGYEMNGAYANDLRDQRNLLIDQLSGIIDITYSEDGNGQLSVQIDGRNLVRHDDVKEVMVSATMTNPVGEGPMLYELYWMGSDGQPRGNAIDVGEGAIRGYMDIRDGNTVTEVGIPYIIAQLDSLCQTIASDFNAIHKQGYTIPIGQNAASLKGVEFFKETDSTNPAYVVRCKDFTLSEAVLDDARNIAGSDMELDADGKTNLQEFNNVIALRLVELINRRDSITVQPDNFDSRYQTILNLIAEKGASLITNAKIQGAVRDNIDEQRTSVSGVSIDEEMTNIIRFNHAYSAASRMITAIDEELDTLINRMGLVGRS